MSSEQVQRACKRLVSAKATKKKIDGLAVQLKRRAIETIRTAARKWATAKFLVEQSFANLGLLLYAVLAVVGMFYAAGFYRSFDIAVLDFYETPDFLLSAVASLPVLVIGALSVLLVIGLLVRTYDASVRGSVYRQVDDVARFRHWRDEAISVGLATFTAPVMAAYIVGAMSAADIKASTDSKFVHVALRDDSAPAATVLSEAERMLLLGTTSRFHFLYQCDADANPGCKDGNPFVVPKENVAAIVKYDRGSDPPKTTATRKPAEVSIPPHLHHSSPLMVIRYGTESGAPTYVFPFRPLSPLTTESQGIEVSKRTREWLRDFYGSLSSCGGVRLTVTGYASRKGFGDPQHESIWKGVAERDNELMNCGLANLRALTVVSELFGLSEDQYKSYGLGALKEAKEALNWSPPDDDEKCLTAKAKKVRKQLLGLCSPEMSLEWPRDDKGIGITVRVRAWGDPKQTWNWLDSDESRILSRSVHIGLEAEGGGEVACPQFQHYL